jgi:two-component system phosphate regulon sensor histidine kinase PhoR
MSRLVSDLLTLSRAELQEYEAPTDRINLIKLLGNLWASLELRAAEKGISIMVKSPRELPEIFGDWDQLIQAFTNLVENAIKYGPESSEITITAAVQQDGAWPDGRPREVVAVSVADQGEGMTRETVERLTERFFRSAEAKARRIPGTGLGLAIVKHIIIRHRGHLNIQSDIGRGTTFTALLPVAE